MTHVDPAIESGADRSPKPVPSPQAQHTQGGQQPDDSRQDAKVVLVMNHNRDPLDELTTALARQGFEIRIGESLAQSYRLAGESKPDVNVCSITQLSFIAKYDLG